MTAFKVLEASSASKILLGIGKIELGGIFFSYNN